MPVQRSAFCLFCDDVRQEAGNKLSFMGIYRADMVFPEGGPSGIPIAVPKFAIVVWLICGIDDQPQHATFSVFIPPGRTEAIKMEYPQGTLANVQEVPPGSVRRTWQLVMPVFNLVLPASGFIEVEVEADGEKLRAGRLKVIIPGLPDTAESSPSPTASPPPSEQSLHDAPVTKPSRVQRRPSSRRSGRTPAKG